MATYDDALRVLRQFFKYEEFRPAQEQAVHAVMKGRDTLALMPTGSGKSLIYQVPSVAMGGTTIVITPINSLMQDQTKALLKRGLHPAYLNSTFNGEQQKEILRRAKNGEFQIMYVAPERLKSEAFLSFVLHADVPLVAVDEAHCVASWGRGFRRDYQEIGSFIKKMKRRPVVVALTATATPETQKQIVKSLHMINPERVKVSPDRPNLSLAVSHLPPEERHAWCGHFARKRKSQSGIFYCVTRREVEELQSVLVRSGISAGKYHAGMTSNDRTVSQEKFLSGACPVMVATSAFGMGIDKPNVRYVVCVGMPLSVDDYFQMIGRAGRDGKPADTVLLWDDKDVRAALRIVGREEKENPGNAVAKYDAQVSKQLVWRMRDYCDSRDCRRDFILRYFDTPMPADGGCGRCDNCVPARIISAYGVDIISILNTGAVPEESTSSASLDINEDILQAVEAAVAALGDKATKAMVANVVSGRSSWATQEFGFENLSCWGAAKGHRDDVWLAIELLIKANRLVKNSETKALALVQS